MFMFTDLYSYHAVYVYVLYSYQFLSVAILAQATSTRQLSDFFSVPYLSFARWVYL